MKYYTQLTDLPILDLHNELITLAQNQTLVWTAANQFCLNTVPDRPSDYMFGTGSLTHDWENSREVVDEYGNSTTVVELYETPYQESDFTVLCDQFKNTLFEQAYNAICEKYVVGRIRIMRSRSKTCLSWHPDAHPRLHYPIKTQHGCFMVIEDEVMHIPHYTWWLTDTLKYHTAFNASKEDRIHLVTTVIDTK